MAHDIRESRVIDDFVASRYDGYGTSIVTDIVEGNADLSSLTAYAVDNGAPSELATGRQERLEMAINRHISPH